MTTEQIVALATAVLTAFGAFLRWAVKLWATVRREAVAAQQAAVAQQRADNERMVEALLESASAQTALAGKIDQLPKMLELVLVQWRDDDASQRRRRTPHGSPVPRNGTDD